MARLDLPPRSCPYCLVGACHRCTGRLTVLDVRGQGRDVPCRHEHPAGRGPAARVLADTPHRDPDPKDMAAALLGQRLPGDDDEVVRCLTAAIDGLANAQVLGPFNRDAKRWQDAARHALAELTPADLVEVLIQYLGPEAAERAAAVRAGVEQVAGGAPC